MGNSGWGIVTPTRQFDEEGGKRSELFMRIKQGRHKIRLVGHPKKIWISWINKEKFIVPEEYIGVMKSLKHPPREQYAILCFDRADTEQGVTQLKILEKGNQIFSHFRTYYEEFSNEPGGKDGCDFRIKATIPPGKDARSTSYEVMHLDKVPFSDIEIALLKTDPNSEEVKSLPIGQRGQIDLDTFSGYDEEKAIEKLKVVIANLSGMPAEGESDSATATTSTPSGKTQSLDSALGTDSKEDTSAAEKSSKNKDAIKKQLDGILF